MQSARKTRLADRQSGGELLLVVLCFLAFRLFALFLLQYGGVFGSGSDFDYYYAMAQQTDHGFWPYLSYWSEYPPIFPWLIVGVYRFAAIFGTPSGTTFSQVLHAILLTFDLGNLLLIYALARRIHGEAVALRSAWLYAILFAPIFVWLGWFDPMPIFWMLLSLWLLARRNTGWAGFAGGIGIVTKIFPGFVFLIAAREAIGRRPDRRGIAAVLIFAIPCAIAVGVVCLPFLIANPQIFATSVRSWFSRLPWESFWAIADGYYLFGIVPSLPARVGWSTYTTPSLSSPILGAAALLALIGAIGGTYLAAWDGTPEQPEYLVDEPWTAARAISAVRRAVAAPYHLVTGLAAPSPRALPRVAIAGLDVTVGSLAGSVSQSFPAGTAAAAPAAASIAVSAAEPTETTDERAFRLVAFAAALYAVIFLVTSGYSPQFMLWMVPFAVILFPSLGAFAWVTAFTLVVIVGERYLYYWYFPPDGLVLGGIVLVRSLLLVGFLGEVLWQIDVPFAAHWPRLRPVAVAITFAAFLTASGVMFVSFANGGWGRTVALDPARLASANLRKTTDQYDAVLVFTVDDYRYLAPWLGDRAFYVLTDPRFATPREIEQTMRSLAATHNSFVVVTRGEPNVSERAATAWLARYGAEVSSTVDKTGRRSTRYQIIPGLAWPAAPPVVATNLTLANEIQLLGYSVTPAADGRQRSITFIWKPLRHASPLDLLLVPDSGAPRVGLIGSAYPTAEWSPGEIVVDPESLPANATSLRVTWRARDNGQAVGSTTINLSQPGR
ncbi:MAG TPA: hypothetical protein VFZ25_08225 [Chloroflexota bacterium]|nr:hypothetical protein [Chloroflexota bacterium]